MTQSRTDAPVAPAKLLVSVRNGVELDQALHAGVDIIDLKEPRHGPLAPASPRLCLAACDRILRLPSTDRPILSAALGEHDDAPCVAASLPQGFDFAKAGPSGCRTETQLAGLWDEVRRRLHPAVDLVAVAYADHPQADCLDAEAVFRLAARVGIGRCLLDTFVKDGRSTFDHIGLGRLRRLSDAASRMNLWWVLAGSIDRDSVSLTRRHGISNQCFGVRGDVCRSGRRSELAVERIRQWQQCLAGSIDPVEPGHVDEALFEVAQQSADHDPT